MNEQSRKRIRAAAARDAHMAAVKAPFLDLPDTDENWSAMLAAVREARETYTTTADQVTFALCAVRIEAPGHWTLLSTSTDRDRLSRLARNMNQTETNPYLLYRTVDYATAVERIRAS